MRQRLKARSGFTLLEVMIASAIFFLCLFAVLELVTRNLHAARNLRRQGPTFGMAAAQLAQTNRLSEGSMNGDFGELYPDYSWAAEIYLAASNGLYQVDFAIYKGNAIDATNTILLYRAGSAVVQGGGGQGGGGLGGGGRGGTRGGGGQGGSRGGSGGQGNGGQGNGPGGGGPGGGRPGGGGGRTR